MAEKKQLNEVERLLKKVKDIQENCTHNFLFVKQVNLLESLVDGVYVGSASGPVLIRGRRIRGVDAFRFLLECPKCSKQEEMTVLQTCPRCLGKMQKGDIENPHQIKGRWVYPRTIYFGEEYLFHSIRLYRCPGCGFAVACDEWNQ